MSPIIALAATPGLDDLKTPFFLERHLQELLSSIQKSTLDPPLTVSDLDPEILKRIKSTTAADDYYKTSLETAHKAILYDISVSQDPDDDATIVAYGNLVDCALIFTELEMADSNMPFTLLEELFDTQIIPTCERLFNYLESRVERLTVGMESGKGKALILLRLCNELLRRLSKAEDTIFCGRILIFLSKSFPIAERSAVNLRGDFNTNNVTIFDTLPEQDEDSMEIDVNAFAENEATTKEGGKAVSFNSQINSQKPRPEPQMSMDKLYTVFWSMQHDFADPTRLFVPENFERFKKGLEATMAKFREADDESLKTTGVANNGGSSAPGKKPDAKPVPAVHAGTKRKRDHDADEVKGGGFNPKYLTSRELFELEISDLTFRRNVLVQAMILLDFLLSLTPAAKGKWAVFKTPNRAVQYAFSLEANDETWCQKTRNQISASLQPDQTGKLFMRLINTVLAREQNWVFWKAEGCHKFDIPALGVDDVLGAKTRASTHCRPERPFPYTMGTPTLNRLWQDTGKTLHLDDLEDEERRRVPTFESFRVGVDKDLEDLKDAMLPADIEEGHNSIQTKTWKAMRLASHTRFPLFNRFDERVEETRNDLQMLADVEAKVLEEVKARTSQQQAQAQVLGAKTSV